jgi:F0F1-type ATP synthase assembly protein I
MNENNKNSKKDHSSAGLPIGMCIGLAVGTAIGAATNNIGTWMPIGLSVGMCIGLMLGGKKTDGHKDEPDGKQ